MDRFMSPEAVGSASHPLSLVKVLLDEGYCEEHHPVIWALRNKNKEIANAATLHLQQGGSIQNHINDYEPIG